jgi:hypothetical protein
LQENECFDIAVPIKAGNGKATETVSGGTLTA